jgi:uncharacterized protein (DUF1330 family)
MSAYVIVEVETTDPELMARYREAARPTVEQYGGRYIARGGTTVTLEGDWDPPRIVIMQFPSMEQARAWWHSDDYAAAKAMRQRAGRSRMLLVDGFEG